MAFDMHLKFQGGSVDIKGSSNHKKHKDCIPILAWSWGVSNSGDLHAGSGSASGGKADVQDITITKFVDGCSNALINACTTGSRIEKGWLYVTNATGEQTDFVTLELDKGVLVTSVSTGGSAGEDRLTENITLHFGKFNFGFQEQDDHGKPVGGKKEFGFDITQVAKS